MIEGEKGVPMSSDVKGGIYEELLQKMRPEPMKTIAAPCCGSGGFFLVVQSFLADPINYILDRTERVFEE